MQPSILPVTEVLTSQSGINISVQDSQMIQPEYVTKSSGAAPFFLKSFLQQRKIYSIYLTIRIGCQKMHWSLEPYIQCNGFNDTGSDPASLEIG